MAVILENALMDAARRLWTSLEPLHAVVYFAPEIRAAGKAIGLKGFWDTYFAFRAAPLGAVSAPAVVGMFGVFEPAMVARALPSAWSRASAETCLVTRSSVSASVLRDIGVAADVCAAAVALLSPVVLAPTGRPMGAANAAVPLPADPVAALWQLATTVREHRGDGHMAALAAAGLSGLEAMHLQLAASGADPEPMRLARGWSPEQWAAARASLIGRGLLSEAGADLLETVENATDFHAWQGGLSAAPADEVVDLLAPAVAAVWASGLVPEDNPIGLKRA
jgi:hypothetical protein